MKEKIINRIQKIDNIQEKETFRTIMEEIFIPLYEETEEKLSAIEQRIEDELPQDYSQFTVYNTIIKKEEAVGYVPWLFPVSSDDLDIEKTYQENSETPTAPITLETVYFSGDYLEYQKLTRDNRWFFGTITSKDKDSFNVKIQLEPARRYKKAIGQVYHLFLENGISWRSLHTPYLYKFLDVVFYPENVQQVEELKKYLGVSGYRIKIDYEKYSSGIKHDLIPVWNIENVVKDVDDFPVPALDKVNYEYYFKLLEAENTNGYLAVDTDKIITTRREKEQFVIVSPSKNILRWNLLTFHPVQSSSVQRFPHDVFSNEQEISYAKKIKNYNSSTVKTKAELFRALKSYNLEHLLKLEGFYFTKQELTGEDYNVNSFILNEMRDQTQVLTLVLQFKEIEQGSLLLRDNMSFLVSEIQLLFPDYKCIGVLL